ncbi:MAG: WxcM-like domain-containing protein [Pseudomonadota bacterium]|nr:WxcM-like domain-containing protein [Pseudomonadota bacterium]
MTQATSVHPSAQVAASDIGSGVRIEALAIVGVGAVLRDGCTVGAGACVGERAHIGAGAVLGDGAIVSSGVHIGERARIEAGALVTDRVPPHAIVRGRSATIVGYAGGVSVLPQRLATPHVGVTDSVVTGVRFHVMREVRDMRGDLCAAEFGADFPFQVRRSFLVYNVPSAEVRGEHAHRQCEQFLMAVQGSVHVVVDDGHRREEFRLDRRNQGLYLPPMVWGTQYRYSEDAVLLVLASHAYDPADYVRDYAQFLASARGGE